MRSESSTTELHPLGDVSSFQMAPNYIVFYGRSTVYIFFRNTVVRSREIDRTTVNRTTETNRNAVVRSTGTDRNSVVR